MVPLLRQVRQRLQLDRLLGRRPPDLDPARLVVVEAVEHGVAEVFLRRVRRRHHGVSADFSHIHLKEKQIESNSNGRNLSLHQANEINAGSIFNYCES